jgi:hypothetical protein
MKRISKNVRRYLFAAIALAILAIVFGLIPFNAGFLKSTIQDAVAESTGMELRIRGPLKIRLGLAPSAEAGDVSLRLADGDPLATVGSISAKLDLPEFFNNHIRIMNVEAKGLTADYCAPLPKFANDSAETPVEHSFSVANLVLEDTAIYCGPQIASDPYAVTLDRVHLTEAPVSGLSADAQGEVGGIVFTLEATAGTLNELLAAPLNFPFTAAIDSQALEARISGTLLQAADGPAASAELELRVTDVRQLANAFDLETPDLGTLAMQGDLRFSDRVLELNRLAGELGRSRFEIDAQLLPGGDRPYVSLDGHFDVLDVEPLIPESSQPGVSQARTDTDLRAIAELLQLTNGEVRLDIGRLTGVPLDVDNVRFSGLLKDGRAEIQELGVETLGGRVSITGNLIATVDCPALSLNIEGQQIDLATLNGLLQLDSPLLGGLQSVAVASSSCGNRILAQLESLHADVKVLDATLGFDNALLPFSTDELTASLRPGEASELRLLGRLNNQRVSSEVSLGSLTELLGSKAWPFRIVATSGHSRLKVEGDARTGEAFLDARVDLQASTIGELSALAGIVIDADLPLHATFNAQLDASLIDVSDIAVDFGESDVNGRISMDRMADGGPVTLTIGSSFLNLAEIIAVLPPPTDRTDGDHTPAPPVILPPIDVDLRIDHVRANHLDLQELLFSAKLRDSLIESAHTSVIVENDITLAGEVNLDLRSLPAKLRLQVSGDNLDVDRVLRRINVSNSLKVRADHLDIHVTGEASTPIDLLLNSQVNVDLQGFSWQIPVANSSNGDLFDVDLPEMQLTIAPGQPTVWRTRGTVDGSDIELLIKTPSLATTFAPDKDLPLKVVTAIDSNVAILDAQWERSIGDHFVAHAILSGAVIPSEGRRLSELVSPLGDYQIETNIDLSDESSSLSDVRMQLGASRASGQISVDRSSPRHRYRVSLDSPYLQTDDLLYWAKDVQEEATDQPEAEDAIEDRSVMFLIRDFLTRYREHNDLDVHIAVDEVFAGQDLLGGARLELHVDSSDFELSPLRITLPGGDVEAEYWARRRGSRLDVGLKVNATALRYSGLLRLVDYRSEASGLLYLDTELTANVEASTDEAPIDLLSRNANGEFRFAAWPENIEAGVLDLWSANVVLALLSRPSAASSSRLNCVATRFDAHDGVLKSQITLLDTTDSIIRGKGEIDLATDQLDLVFWPQAKREKFLSVSTPITVTGSVEDFQIGVEPAGFLGTLTKWYTAIIYVPFKWLTGERFAADGTSTCFDAMDWDLTPELHDYFLRRDFSTPPDFSSAGENR